MASHQTVDGMPSSYARWRSSRLGRITDKLEQELLLNLLSSVAGKTLLDIGCGDGAFTTELARRGALATGLDVDPAMLAAARQRSRQEALPLQLVEGRAEALPFQDGTFDVALAVTSLCFVQDTRRAISEMARILRPGGRLIIGELGRRSLWAVQRRIRAWLGDPIWRVAKFRTAADLRALIDDAGLNVIELRGTAFYPPCSIAALLFAPADPWLGRMMTFGAAFLAVSAEKPTVSIGSKDQ